MLRSSNFTSQQVDLLLDFLEVCPQLVSGMTGGKIPTKHHQTLAWEAIAQRLSEDGLGAPRTGEQVRSKWIDLKYRTRTKIRKLIKMKEQYEEPKDKDKLSATEKRILLIINEKPDDCVADTDFDSSAFRCINSEEAIIAKSEDTSNDTPDRGWAKKILQEIECEFSEEEESPSSHAAQEKTPECTLLCAPSTNKRSSSAERVSLFRARKRRLIEEGFEKKAIATQEKMASDINDIKLSINEMKNDMNTYMKRIDQKFDKMLDLLAVALNVEPHDIES